MSEQLNIILNGKTVTGYKNETILQFARRNGVEIPTLCFDDRLEPYSSCYICVVEVEGMRGLQPACSTRLSEGMKINTDNEKVYAARKTALDLLLSNHYADCTGPCKQTCPAGVDVQGYISCIEKGQYSEAVAIIKETNPFPAVCGRVCVRPCEVACRRNLLNEGSGVGIDYLKRYAADKDLDSPNKYVPQVKASTGKKVAIIGGGPAGFAAAFFLQKEGHQCDIYEAAPKAGGWLRYGIPEYRLPNDLLQREIDNITDLGVNVFYNTKLGDKLNYDTIRDKYDASVLTIGCQKGTTVGCEGDDAENVLSGIEFLKTMEVTGRKFDFKGKTVAVVGGGNTAMDCCRSSIRCGADKVVVVYRRTEAEMPANPIEIHESKLEGVEYLLLTAPVKINKDENGKLKSMRCIKMELGEPDASGRRRPVPVEGSDFEMEFDYILAAIGQKTEADFLAGINKSINNGELKTNKWGDLDADSRTLQTGISNIFAAGDGVTGAATLIQAVAQARIAARSCNQYLSGQPIEPAKAEFISKRDNFKEQKQEYYTGLYKNQLRHEMPTLDPRDRMNFNEVELGYENNDVAMNETHRCLECGCTEYFTCDLKHYASTYGAEQKRFEGEYMEYSVDFRHPFIEIDNNKCILCSRCVRICSEINGAKALGLINRGYKTYVAPAMGESLRDTDCESCGLCISTCPTGALTENVKFKPGPVKTTSFNTICNYCSLGCEIIVHHNNGYVMKISGNNGKSNPSGNICKYAKFGYSIYNDKTRITRPMLKVNGEFKEIQFEKAYEIIAEKIKSTASDENGFFAGARLSNEEMYLIQKLARFGAATNNITSFHYARQMDGFNKAEDITVSFDQLKNATHIYLLNSEINMENAVAGYLINNLKVMKGIAIDLITTYENSRMKHKVDKLTKIKDEYKFIKAVNHYLITAGLQNELYIRDNCEGFNEYKNHLLAENFDELVSESGCDKDRLVKFAEEFNKSLNAVLIYAEKNISSQTAVEIRNLCLITGKYGKTSMGLLPLKEKNNSRGLFDMGICSTLLPGGKKINDKNAFDKIKDLYKKEFTQGKGMTYSLFNEGKLKNIFIFGEDPVGCAIDSDFIKQNISKATFTVVQDYFLTETAKNADLILPASFPYETGGSFTNTLGHIQKTEIPEELPRAITHNSIEQLAGILKYFGDHKATTAEEVMNEIIPLLEGKTIGKYQFDYSAENKVTVKFKHGCDNINKRFDEYFAQNIN